MNKTLWGFLDDIKNIKIFTFKNEMTINVRQSRNDYQQYR